MTQAMQHDRRNVEGALPTEVDELLAGYAGADDQGRAATIEALYHHYKPVAVGYAKRGRAGDFEGVVDLALFDTFRALGSLRTANDLTFRSYLFRAIQSYSIKEGRKPIPTPVEIYESEIEPVRGFETDLVGSMHVDQLINELPEDQRAVMTHRFIHGRTADETGLILGKKTNAVYQLQHRATKRLQRILLTAAVLLIVVGAAIVAVRQANRQAIDSSPARPVVVEQNELPTTTTSRSVDNARTETTIGGQTNLDADQQIQAGVIEDQQAVTPQPDRAAVGAAPADATTEDTVSKDAASSDASASPDVPATTIPVGELTSTTADQQVTATTTLQVVVALDDVLQLTVGQTVDFNVMANDGPATAIDSVTWISGVVDGLTLGEDGRLTGIPTEAGTDTIFYRLNGNNDTFDTGQVRVVVE